VVAVLDNFEMAINFKDFVFEPRVFNKEDGKLENLHRTNYIKTDKGYIIPIEETGYFSF